MVALNKPYLRGLALWLGIGLLVFLAACSPMPGVVPPSTKTPTIIPSPVVRPTSTVTPLPPVLLLLAPEGADDSQVQRLEAELAVLAEEEGLGFQTANRFPPDEPSQEIALAVVLPPDPGVASLARQAPEAEFLAVGISGLEAGGNLSVIGAQGTHPDWQGFLAGYLAAMVTTDWRVGAIGLSDDLQAQAARQGFLNGVRYFCGACRPVYPPYIEYPRYVEMPAASTAEEWRVAIDLLLERAVRTVYLAPGTATPDVLTYLATKEVAIIASEPPRAALSAQWLATITADPLNGVADVVRETLRGKRSVSVEVELQLEVNPEKISSGRLRLAEILLDELLAGFVDPGVEP